MSRYFWGCDLVGSVYDPLRREDIQVRIYDREQDGRTVHTVSLPQVTFDESREQSQRVFDLFLVTQQEN
jgi:hypothetical protein